MIESEAIRRVTKEISDNRLLIHEIYKDFESRTCENCKWYQKRKGWQLYSCENLNVLMWIDAEVPYFSPKSTFKCSKFERKEDDSC